MAEKDKELADNIAKILCSLPANKKEYLAGVADGMSVMAAVASEKPHPKERRDGA